MTTAEIQNAFQIRKLAEGEAVSRFDCGDDDLNDFLLNDADVYRKALLSVTYVLENKETKEVVAYFSLANDRICIEDFPTSTDFNRFRKHRFVQAKRIRSYPAAKVCRLGVDNSVKGQSIGKFILEFIKTFFVYSNKTGCRFLTVDAYANAASFYLRNGFEPLKKTEDKARTEFLYFDLNQVLES